MKATVLRAYNTPMTLENVPDPQCPPDGVIVRLLACGVCRSDLHAVQGQDPDVVLPHVPGHEFAGEIVEIGPECAGFQMGERVTAPFILACGACDTCRTGEPTACDNQDVIGFTQWGAFAEYVAVPRAGMNLVRLPEAMPHTVAAGMGCRVTTAWRALSDRAQLRSGEWLAVHGSGGIGLAAIMLGSAMGARVIAVDVNPAALELARNCGAEFVVDASAGDEAKYILELTQGGAHVSIDALGRRVTIENALRSLRKLGRYVQVGMPVGEDAIVPIPMLELVYSRQLSLHGMRGLSAAGFGDLFTFVSDAAIDFQPLITREIALSQASETLTAMAEGQLSGVSVITDFTM